MEQRNRRKLAGLGAGLVLAVAGVTGVVLHTPVHAAASPASSAQLTDANVSENTNGADPVGPNQQDTTGVDNQDSNSAGTPDKATEKSGTETDPIAPCVGTGDTQTGDCATGSGTDTAGAN